MRKSRSRKFGGLREPGLREFLVCGRARDTWACFFEAKGFYKRDHHNTEGGGLSRQVFPVDYTYLTQLGLVKTTPRPVSSKDKKDGVSNKTQRISLTEN